MKQYKKLFGIFKWKNIRYNGSIRKIKQKNPVKLK